MGQVAGVLGRWGHVRPRLHRRADDGAHLAAVELTSHEWSWQADVDLVVTRSSPAVRSLLGVEPGDILGRCLLDLVHPDDRPLARCEVAAAVRERRGWEDLELRWLHSSGEVVSLEGSAVPVVDRQRRVVGFRETRRAVPADAVSRRRLVATVHRVNRLVESEEPLDVALQPIVDLSTGLLSGLEALARFPDGRPPDVWFAEAHEAGVGVQLEMLALHAQVSLLQVDGALPGDSYLSVNASPALILDSGFHALMRSAGVPLDRLVLEVTEHAAVSSYDQIRAELLPYRERGMRLAVDDTGAGYASFNHVLRLRPEIIKLDRSLLTDIDTDPARRAFVTAIVLLALELDSSVVAEGVERRAEHDTLRTLGVDAAQGFLLARPHVSPAVWEAWAGRNWLAHVGSTIVLPAERSPKV